MRLTKIAYQTKLRYQLKLYCETKYNIVDIGIEMTYKLVEEMQTSTYKL